MSRATTLESSIGPELSDQTAFITQVPRLSPSPLKKKLLGRGLAASKKSPKLLRPITTPLGKRREISSHGSFSSPSKITGSPEDRGLGSHHGGSNDILTKMKARLYNETR